MHPSTIAFLRRIGICVRCLSVHKARGWFAEPGERPYPSQVCLRCMTRYEESIFVDQPKRRRPA